MVLAELAANAYLLRADFHSMDFDGTMVDPVGLQVCLVRCLHVY
jgi:hypothetical protein